MSERNSRQFLKGLSAQIRHYDDVIELKYCKPSGSMIVNSGVELREHDKVVTGPPVSFKNRVSLTTYKKGWLDP